MESQSESRKQFTVSGSAIQDMELREEWQDEEFPRPLPEDPHSPLEEQENPPTDRPAPPTTLTQSGTAKKRLAAAPTLSNMLNSPPTTLTLSGTAKKRLAAAPTLSNMLNCDSPAHSAAGHSTDTPPDTPSLDINLDGLDTPSDSQSYSFPDLTHDLEWEDDLPRLGRREAGGGADEEDAEERAEQGGGVELEQQFDQTDSRGQRWRRFCIAGQEYHVNMSVLQPYLQVLSHGGYYGDNMTAIILVSSCFLPENSVEQYEYVMDNLFRYIVGTLDLMVSEDYVLVYLCGMAPRNKLPSMKWLRQCYTSIDRRLKKDLKGLFVVHPAWYIKALIMLVKPFISEKFSRKLCFISSLHELSEMLPLDHLQIPECIRQFDDEQNR